MNWVTKILQNDINDTDTVIDIGCGNDFSIINSIIHYIRTKMNKIKW